MTANRITYCRSVREDSRRLLVKSLNTISVVYDTPRIHSQTGDRSVLDVLNRYKLLHSASIEFMLS